MSREGIARRVALEALVYLDDLAGLVGDIAQGQNSIQLRYQFLAEQGCEALGLADIDEARAEVADPLEPKEPKVKFYPGDGTEVEIEVAFVSEFPRGVDGTCAFCHGDPCAEAGGDTDIARYAARNKTSFETCPCCGGRPT